jgi:hypothetical protein
MWFKTRAGIVRIEGSVELLADRWPLNRGGRGIGVFAYQAHHPEMTAPRIFRSPVQVTNRKVYLACFLDHEDGYDVVSDCMRRIERSIRQNEAICDLSDMGDDAAWNAADWTVLVRWRQGL